MSSLTSTLNLLVPVASTSLLAVDRSGCLVYVCTAALVVLPGTCGLMLLREKPSSAEQDSGDAEQRTGGDSIRGSGEGVDLSLNSDKVLSEPLITHTPAHGELVL